MSGRLRRALRLQPSPCPPHCPFTAPSPPPPKAKTIDLCNNPKTKEPKLTAARRIIAEWPGLDAEQVRVWGGAPWRARVGVATWRACVCVPVSQFIRQCSTAERTRACKRASGPTSPPCPASFASPQDKFTREAEAALHLAVGGASTDLDAETDTGSWQGKDEL